MRKRKDLRLPNKYGGVVYLGGNRRKPYGARITIGFEPKGEKNGVMQYRQKYKYLGFFEKRTQALECLVEYNKNPYDLDLQSITLIELYEKWSERHFEKVSKNSIIAYKNAFRNCEPIYKIRFKELKINHLQGIIDNSSVSTAKTLKVVFKMLYDYAIKHDLVEKNYAQYIEIKKVEKEVKHKLFSKQDINKLWSNIDKPYVDVVLVLLYTGMRITELIEMKYDNVHLNERYMVGGIKTTAGINRTIPIHKEISPIINKKLNQKSLNKKYLFQSFKGKKMIYSNVRSKISDLFKELDIDHVLHDTRHTFVSQAHKLGINDLIIKRIVGHSNKDITEHYTHIDKEDLINAIDKFVY